MGSKQSRGNRDGTLDVEILRTGVLLSAHQARHRPAGLDPLPVGVPSDVGVANAAGVLESFARQDHVHNHPFLGGNFHVYNRAAGIVPVAATWNVNPANLANSTDGDYATVTGNGSKVLGAAGYFGQLTWDLGAIYKIMVRGLIGLGNNFSGDDCVIFLSGSNDGATYTPVGLMYDGEVAREWIGNTVLNRWIGDHFMRCRYVRLIWRGMAAGTWYGNVTELEAIDLGV